MLRCNFRCEFVAFFLPLTRHRAGDSVPQNRAGIGPLGKDILLKIRIALAMICFPFAAFAQGGLPSSYGAPEHQWATPPAGAPWGSSAGIERGPHGEIWAIDRCGANSCDGSDKAPIVQLDAGTGKALKSIGAGLFVFPHGLHVDAREGRDAARHPREPPLGERVEPQFGDEPATIILAVLSDKDVAGIWRALAPIAQQVILSPAHTERTLAPVDLAQIVSFTRERGWPPLSRAQFDQVFEQRCPGRLDRSRRRGRGSSRRRTT